MQTDWDYSCHMLTQFSKGSNEQDNPASNIDEILPGDTRVSSVLLNRAIFHKLNVS
jgi:hypothetical protein